MVLFTWNLTALFVYGHKYFTYYILMYSINTEIFRTMQFPNLSKMTLY